MPDCRGCGRPCGDDIPTPEHCGECPPWQCSYCGEMATVADPCPCWTSLEGMPLADIKALFARDGGFQLDHRPEPS